MNYFVNKMGIKVEVEYCDTCGYANKFQEMKEILEKQSQANVVGFEGRRASFEVKINDTLVHSKLSTMAFPDFDDVSNIITEIASGEEVRVKCKQQPITNCVIM